MAVDMWEFISSNIRRVTATAPPRGEASVGANFKVDKCTAIRDVHLCTTHFPRYLSGLSMFINVYQCLSMFIHVYYVIVHCSSVLSCNVAKEGVNSTNFWAPPGRTPQIPTACFVITFFSTMPCWVVVNSWAPRYPSGLRRHHPAGYNSTLSLWKILPLMLACNVTALNSFNDFSTGNCSTWYSI